MMRMHREGSKVMVGGNLWVSDDGRTSTAARTSFGSMRVVSSVQGPENVQLERCWESIESLTDSNTEGRKDFVGLLRGLTTSTGNACHDEAECGASPVTSSYSPCELLEPLSKRY